MVFGTARADTLIRDGQLAEFKRLICEAPCRYDPAFQWGVCQRLGVIAGDSKWDPETRQSAIAFLGEMYRDDIAWGDQPNVKQWIVNILIQMSSVPGVETQCNVKDTEYDGNRTDIAYLSRLL